LCSCYVEEISTWQLDNKGLFLIAMLYQIAGMGWEPSISDRKSISWLSFTSGELFI
jgi:hypothetical protein